MSSQHPISSFFSIFLLSITLLSCASGDKETMNTTNSDASVADQINSLIAADQYTEALALLDTFEESEEVLKLK